MAKHKKKRNKIYQGPEAAMTRPVITRISAVNRSKLSQWWFDRKAILRPILITAAIALFIIIMIYEIIKVSTGGSF